jgi:hypothetical protein
MPSHRCGGSPDRSSALRGLDPSLPPRIAPRQTARAPLCQAQTALSKRADTRIWRVRVPIPRTGYDAGCCLGWRSTASAPITGSSALKFFTQMRADARRAIRHTGNHRADDPRRGWRNEPAPYLAPNGGTSFGVPLYAGLPCRKKRPQPPPQTQPAGGCTAQDLTSRPRPTPGFALPVIAARKGVGGSAMPLHQSKHLTPNHVPVHICCCRRAEQRLQASRRTRPSLA